MEANVTVTTLPSETEEAAGVASAPLRTPALLAASVTVSEESKGIEQTVGREYFKTVSCVRRR
jgi:hypothetical protein